MTKAMFGIAASLGLAISPAFAGIEPPLEKDTPTVQKSSEPAVEGESATGRVVLTRTASGAMIESKEARTSHEVKSPGEQRWLEEREGYRDGGY